MKSAKLCQFLAVVLPLAGCGRPPQPTGVAPPTVTVAHPVEERITDSLQLTGTVSPFRSVDLVARVTGYLKSADFAEGAWVEAGTLLFVIEPEPYEQQMLLAKAALLRAQSEYDRQVELRTENATSAAAVERWLSERDQAAAQLELAKINLDYTRVRAPFSGRIGRRFVDPGNLVGPNVNTKLATLEQIVPIYVTFSLNERDALQVRDTLRERGAAAKLQPNQVPVLVGLQNQNAYPNQGFLDFVDTGLDPSSGTILLRAIFKNEERGLLPGFFARVCIPLGAPQLMPVLPTSAIGNDQEGDYVLVVDRDGLVTRRSVIKGPLTGRGCAIRRGIITADRVIVSGQIKARPGLKVIAVGSESGADHPPGASAQLSTQPFHLR